MDLQKTAENIQKRGRNGECRRSLCFFCNCHIEPGEEIADGQDSFYHRDCYDLLFGIRLRRVEFDKLV